MRKKYDVVVVGAGPVGSYTAYRLADYGLSVCLIDKKKEIGKDVICAGVISKRAFKKFDLPGEAILSRIDSATFFSPSGKRLEYNSNDVFAYVVDRSVFDSGLAKLAKRVGVDVRLNQQVTDIKSSGKVYTVVSRRRRYQAKAVVLATGVNYDLHKKVGLGRPPRFLYGSQIELPFSFSQTNIQIHINKKFAPGSFGWVIPAGTNNSRVGVVLLRRGKLWLKKMLESCLSFSAGKLNDSEIKIKPIAFGPVRKSIHGKIIALGEAAGQIKTTTGGGIFFGLLCSEIAVEKLVKVIKEHGSLDDYELTWRSVLASEIDIGIRLRRIAGQLNNDEIEALFDFVKKHRFWVDLLIPRIDFDYHSNFIFFCLKSFGSLLKIPED